MHTTFIVGAGASKAVWDLPVLGEFLAACHDELQKDTYKELREFISSRFGELDKTNLEEVLTDLDNILTGLGGMWYSAEGHPERTRALRARAQLVGLIRHGVECDIGAPDTWTPQYDVVFRDIQAPDQIVTFNYDMGLENYLNLRNRKGNLEATTGTTAIQGSREYYLSLMAERMHHLLCDIDPGRGEAEVALSLDWSMCLLKLHGSVDFATCSNQSCPKRLTISTMPIWGVSPQICYACGADLEGVIIPPSLIKPFERHPKIAMMWRLASVCLNRSERLIIWGFSCPPTDHQVLSLFRSCREQKLIKSVVLIDPSADEVRKRLRPVLDPQDQLSWSLYSDHKHYQRGEQL